MDEFLKKLVESKLLTEDTVDSVKKALEEKIAEVEALTEGKVRKELSEQYEHDKKLLIKAIDSMVGDRLKEELAEFSHERSHLRKMTAKAAKAIAESDLKAEKKVKVRIKALEAMVNTNLHKEIEEFHEDRKIQRMAAVKALRESKAKAEHDRQVFINRGANVLQTLIENNLRGFMNEFKKDIMEARRNDFGRRIVEAFGAEFRNTFFNENVEAKKLAKKLHESEKRVEKLSKAYNTKSKKLNEALVQGKKERRQLVEGRKRSEIMGGLLTRLSGPAKTEMKTLLESVPTDKLEKTFNRYLPTVVKSVRTGGGRRSLNETATVLRTGNRNVMNEREEESSDADLSRLRYLVNKA